MSGTAHQAGIQSGNGVSIPVIIDDDTCIESEDELEEELQEIGRVLSQTRSYAINPQFKEDLQRVLLEWFRQERAKRSACN